MVRGAAGVLLSFCLMLFVMFYCLRDGAKMLDYLARLSPLSSQQEQLLLARVQAVSRSAIMGTLVTGVAQGGLAMIAFAVAGIPWLLWGVMLGFASFIPLVGTALIWVPCVAYLLVMGKVAMAIGLALWCLVVVGLVDNLLRPWLMQGQTGMASVVLFFAILGGIKLFGLPGVIYGPLVIGLCTAVFYILELELGPPPRPVRPPVSITAPAADNGDREGDFAPRRRHRKRRFRDRDRRDGDDGPPRMSTDSGPY